MRSTPPPIALAIFVLAICTPVSSVHATLIQYGDQDVLGTGVYRSDPLAGATLEALAPDVVTYGALVTRHHFPFGPSVDDHPGTDQIFTAAVQTAQWDGYSTYAGRTPGPQLLLLDYSSLLSPQERVVTLTLGIAADDFQYPQAGEPFRASLNGVWNPTLSDTLNALHQSGPEVRFFTIGVDPSLLVASHVLSLSIEQIGNGRDGWAVDFATIGVTTMTPTPESSSALLLGLGLTGLAIVGSKRSSRAPRLGGEHDRPIH